MSDPKKQVDYSFMKSGFSLVNNKKNSNLSQEEENNILSMLTMFSSNAIINASKYVELSKRNGITSQDMKNGLIFEVFEFTKRENFKEDLEKTKKEFIEKNNEDNGEDDEWEDVDDYESEKYLISDSELNKYERILNLSNIEMEDRDFVNKYHKYIDSWDDWTPSNSIEKIMKNAINNINV